jgi:hypothetical protein
MHKLLLVAAAVVLFMSFGPGISAATPSLGAKALAPSPQITLAYYYHRHARRHYRRAYRRAYRHHYYHHYY